MKKLIVTSATFLLLVAPLVLATPALAANDVTFNADTTLDLSNPDVNITVVSGSIIDSITPSAGTISVTMSNGGALTLRSSDRKAMSHNSSFGSTFTCGDSYSELVVTGGTGTNTFTVTVSSGVCTAPSGGSSTPVSTTPTTTTKTETSNATTTNEVVKETPAEGKTPTTGTTTAAPETATGGTTSFAKQLANILSEATDVITANAETIAEKAGAARNSASETNASSKYIKPLTAKTTVTEKVASTMTNFIVYGTQTTKTLGAGERAGVLNSFKNAFDKLPETETDWQDTIKIANGRFPKQQNIEKEKKALATFGKIYLRMPDFKNTRDEAALKIIAYGIRPTTRNLDSEKAAIKTFKNIYGKNPSDTTDWDITRAISYSGAKR